MDFYTSIADQYHHIFPLNNNHVHFTNSVFAEPGKTALLEAGCGVGLLSMELAKTYQKVIGIDLDEKMLLKAEERKLQEQNIHHPEFYYLNMLSILERFGDSSFDGILCYGNTLVHLDSDGQVLDFFTQCRKVLKPGGKLLFQILNYDWIINKKITALPVDENEFIRFERSYAFPEHSDKIEFKTKLLIKENQRVIENSIPLYPLNSKKVKALLLQSGFTDFSFFGDYHRTPFASDSEILVVESM
ncbi:MAG: class I SAM-dependent methyltransferase [Caldisericia bacterium]|nr:class I SAM-dependent methyltransferase [Caldisericia bacterium]